MAGKSFKHTFIVRTEGHLSSAVTYLLTNYQDAVKQGEPLHVHVTSKQDNRTVAQNRLYWMWLNQIAESTGNDKDALHYELKKKFLIAIYERDDQGYAEMCQAIKTLKQSQSEQYAAIAKGVIHETTTTKMTVKQFTEYLNAIHDYALARLGLMLTVPDELQWAVSN